MSGAPAPQMPVSVQAAQASPVPQMVDPVGIIDAKVNELEQWAADMLPLVSRVHPPLKALLVPLANIGMQFRAEVAKLRERAGAISPQAGMEATPPAAAGMPPGLA